jgi:hypothetical protein
MYNRKNRKAGSIRQNKQFMHTRFVKPKQGEQEGILRPAMRAGTGTQQK